MSFLIGFGIALAIGYFAHRVGPDRHRVFYPAVLVVIALLYALFAVMGGSMAAFASESVPIALFLLVSFLGLRFSPWLLVAGLAAHGVFDFTHGRLITNPGVPAWWPMFCLSYDITAALYLAWLLCRRAR